MNIGIDHGYYAIKTRHFSFPAGIAEYSHEPYTLQNTLEFGGKFYVCGTGRQPILRNKMENDNYYLLTLAAIAKEIKQRGGKTECSVRIAAGLPLAGFGREKKPFWEYLLRSSQLADGLRPVCFQFEGIAYKITIEDVFNKVSGTTGLTGSADATFVLEKETRASDAARLYCVGRDIEYQEFVLRFRECSWEMEKDENFLAKHCDNIENVDFSFFQTPDEYYGMEIN